MSSWGLQKRRVSSIAEYVLGKHVTMEHNHHAAPKFAPVA